MNKTITYITSFLWLLIFSASYACAQNKQTPLFTELRTAEEVEKDEWSNKIVAVETLANHIVRLISSKDKYASGQWECIQVLDKRTGKLTQTIDLKKREVDVYYEWIVSGDYNFDGFSDFYLAASATRTNSWGYYFLYDKETGEFVESEELTGLLSLEFTDRKTVIERVVQDDAAYVKEYQYIDNKLALVASDSTFCEPPLSELALFYSRINSGTTYARDMSILDVMKGYARDSISIDRTFKDSNGKNKLKIKVINPCCLDDDAYRVDGMINYISVEIANKNFADTLIYYNPDVLMSLISLSESKITLKSIGRRKAVFIPFSYCCNADDDVRMGIIVCCNDKISLYHINLRGEDFANYKINDDLDETFAELSPALKKKLIQFIETQYQTFIHD